ncbi:MAG: hypothetical protein HY293_04235 [Planctomycetes bacterium]|nr:hypothetical protein [Planctomycetota bacterium]
MKKRLAGLALCLLLAGCSSRGGKNDEFPFTPFPYANNDEFYETFLKTFVNVPVWTVEGAAMVAFMAAYLWIQMGAPGISRR